MSYLLDTNFVIGLLRGASSYWDYLDKLVDETVPAVSAVTRSEVFAGCHPHEESATKNLLDRFEAIAIQSSIADLAGRYVYQYRKRGFTIHLEDALIGSTAVLEGLVLVTRNVDHFPMLMLGHNLVRFPD
jgi:predicted nucleic acid-binding protein